MPLPVLSGAQAASSDDLIRLFHRCQLHWSRHAAEEHQLDYGSAMLNPELDQVHEANQILFAALPETNHSPQQAIDAVEEFYGSRASRCWKWVVNPSAPRERVAPLVERLQQSGYREHRSDIFYLRRLHLLPLTDMHGLKVFPARASFKHVRQLWEERHASEEQTQLVEYDMLHLDDPHFDALIATRNGQAVGYVGVLAIGEIGYVGALYVGKNHRRQGIGRMMMGRAMEICARSLFKHVFVDVSPNNAPAKALYGQLGFQKIGDLIEYAQARP